MKKKLLFVLQAAITVAVLCWIFRDPNTRAQYAKGFQHIDYTWMGLAILLAGLQFTSGALRWFCLMRVQDLKLSLRRVFGITLMGHFFNLFLPGGTGGDIIRCWYLFQEEPNRKTVGFLTLVMDRILGLLALIAISAVIIALRYEWFTQNPLTAKLLWILMFLLAGGLGSVVASLFVTGFKLQHKLPAKLPGRDMLIELASAYDIYAKRPMAVLNAFLLSIVGHVIYFSVFYLVARAFSAGVSFIDLFSVMPIVGVGSALPLSLSGVGVREKLFEDLLGKLCGIDAGTSILISTFGFMCFVCWALTGAVIFMLYKTSGSGHASLSEMRKDIEKIEHDVTE